ncbi:HTH-type transcriptional activator RhaR [Commensalibacter sp. Nvir]|uniref:AraC family transcriptional regulator n=1 Tax=Commensalibacter sp. Nvir TaxID=3069817 RepID=UPI002D3C774B|nr:HTH-type transcriptional activator RhaR [Commensalibacter sp. Nvir]
MLNLNIKLPIRVQNGGLFISRGVGSHPKRRLNSWELVFVESGKLAIQEENVRFDIGVGESLLLWPQRWHTGIGKFSSDLKFYWIHFELQSDQIVDRQFSESTLSFPQYKKVSNFQYMLSLFRQFLAEQENIAHQYLNNQNQTKRSRSLEFILLLIFQHLDTDNYKTVSDSFLSAALAWKARQLILTQYHLNLSTSKLAQQLKCNADYLGRIYHRTFHITITEAIRHQRLIKAQKLLLSKYYSICEVALQCGFGDVGYFRQVFQKK